MVTLDLDHIMRIYHDLSICYLHGYTDNPLIIHLNLKQETMGTKTRIKRKLKVTNDIVLSVDQPKQRYKKPDTLCKITIANIQETKARSRAKKLTSRLIPVIKSHFGISFHYDFN